MTARLGRRAPSRKAPSAAPAVPPPGRMALAENLDRAGAPALAQALLAARGAEIEVDASAVQHLGAQCAQVLLSARMTWGVDGQPFRIARHSAAFTEGARLLGLSVDLGE